MSTSSNNLSTAEIARIITDIIGKIKWCKMMIKNILNYTDNNAELEKEVNEKIVEMYNRLNKTTVETFTHTDQETGEEEELNYLDYFTEIGLEELPPGVNGVLELTKFLIDMISELKENCLKNEYDTLNLWYSFLGEEGISLLRQFLDMYGITPDF